MFFVLHIEAAQVANILEVSIIGDDVLGWASVAILCLLPDLFCSCYRLDAKPLLCHSFTSSSMILKVAIASTMMISKNTNER